MTMCPTKMNVRQRKEREEDGEEREKENKVGGGKWS